MAVSFDDIRSEVRRCDTSSVAESFSEALPEQKLNVLEAMDDNKCRFRFGDVRLLSEWQELEDSPEFVDMIQDLRDRSRMYKEKAKEACS